MFRTVKSFVLFLLCLASLPLAGCSMGFTNLRPGEDKGQYNHMFEDVITTFDSPHWLWVRGTIAGDMNGNGIIEEEIVIATIQKGTPQNPGPIEVAFLVLCEDMPDGGKRAMARTKLFGGHPVPDAPRPENDLDIVSDALFTHVRAQMVPDKKTLTESVVVYFWSDETPGSVWYAGYTLKDGGLVKNLETVMYQKVPGFLTANLDRGIEATPYGYQLVFGVEAVPEGVLRKLGDQREEPLYGHVYARNDDGVYEQADKRYGESYQRIEPAWNQLYLKALMLELPDDELAWFEYHMGLINYYIGDIELARRYLTKASANARDDLLVGALERALPLVDEPERPWPPKKDN